MALEEAKSDAEDQREEAVRQVQHLQHELTHAQTHAAKHERDSLQVCQLSLPVSSCVQGQEFIGVPYLKGCLSTLLSDTLDMWSTCLEHM